MQFINDQAADAKIEVIAGEGKDAYWGLSADQSDDTADDLLWKMAAAGTCTESIGGNTVRTIAADGSVTHAEAQIFSKGVTFSAAITNADAIVSSGTVTGTEGVFDGKWAVVGGNATTGLMVQAQNVTVDAAHTIITQSFVTAYANGTTPIVIASYEEDPGDVQPLYVDNIASNSFQCHVTAGKDFNYVAVGDRP